MENLMNVTRMTTLDGLNYQSWRAKMEDLLYVREYYKSVFLEVKPEDMDLDRWRILHRQTCGFIRMWVGENVLNHISGEENARSL